MAPERPRVFCASLADVFDAEAPDAWRQELWTLIEQCYGLDWLLLTKRPENMLTMLPATWLRDPLRHVWLGVTGENEEWYTKRVDILNSIPAAVRWVSYEPSLGPIAHAIEHTPLLAIDWLIIGGESAQGSAARPFAIEWAEDAITACRGYGIVPFVKQLGDAPTYHGRPYPIRTRAGTEPSEWPESIRVREFPRSMVH